MKKNLLGLLAVCALVFTACNKDKDVEVKSLESEIAGEYYHLTVPVSGYDIEVTETLEKVDDSEYYTNGIIEYRKDGDLLAKVDFGDGTNDAVATKEKDGEKDDIDLTQKDEDGDGEKDKDDYFKKVVVEPIVKADDCDYITSGIIKYYKDGEWLATVDYGDGTCDNEAVKETEEGFYTFTLDK